MPRVLVIEDDEVTARGIADELAAHGIDAERAADGPSGLARACAPGLDAITLDLLLPGLDGLAVITRLRALGIATPVLMISALGDVDERVRGLRAGGDDYLVKPFALDEMVARVEVLLRRQRMPVDAALLRAADLELDRVRHRATRAGVPLALLPTELKLLECLMQHAGQVLTRAMIFERVWGYQFDPGTNLIDVHIARLRKKIDAGTRPALIQTVRGTGYRLAQAD